MASIESPHPYSSALDQTWSYTELGSPPAITVVFDVLTEVENTYDFIYVTDKLNVPVLGSPFTGTTLAGQSFIITGDTVNVRLVSDSSVEKWGFAATVTGDFTPQASFYYQRSSNLVPDEVINFVNISYGNITDYLWDFGDGDTSTELSPTHAYSVAGTYDVSLTVTFDDLSTDTKTISGIVVSAANSLNPNFAQLTVPFNVISSSGIDCVFETANELLPVVVYGFPYTYTLINPYSRGLV
jgi:PKD repeat protein